MITITNLRHSRRKPYDQQQSLPNPSAGQIPSFFLFPWFCLFWACCGSGTVHHVACWVWFLSLCMCARLRELLLIFKIHITVKATVLLNTDPVPGTASSGSLANDQPTHPCKGPEGQEVSCQIGLFFWPHLVACRILIPDQGSNPGPLQWKH